MRHKQFSSEQEAFWAGEFGSAYATRNRGDSLLASNLSFFSRALRVAGPIGSAIEFGANIGMNLRALSLLYPDIDLNAVEINPDAAEECRSFLRQGNVAEESILTFSPDRTFDLVLIKGVLIHINPDSLSTVYEKLVAATRRFLLVAEYYNPVPVAVEYRGHSDRLFKRDFCGELLDGFPSLTLLDYGFVYRRDPVFPQDDITWFLLEKR